MKNKYECDIITADNKTNRNLKLVKILWYAAVAIFGGLYYVCLELLWRGYSHWTMIAVGGAAILCMYAVFDENIRIPGAVKCLISAAAVCFIEFVSGCIINLWLGFAVWDYSTQSLNLLGQVCPLFFCVWFILSIPASSVCRLVHRIENIVLHGSR